MEQMQKLVSGVCMLSLSTGLCSLLRTGKTFERQIHFLLSMLFVIVLIAPFRSLTVPDMTALSLQEESALHTGTLTEETEHMLIEEARRRICTRAGELLTQEGIDWKEVDASVHIDENRCIYISEVSVRCRDAQKAQTLLKSAFGEEVSVYAAEVDG